jgi:hypothetical protein
VGKWFAIVSLLALLACQPELPDSPGQAQNFRSIELGKSLGDLELFAGTSRLLATDPYENSVSIVDLVLWREVARVPLPVPERDAEGELTHAYVDGTTVDEENGRIWAVSTEGQIFTIDLETFAVKTLFSDPDLSFEDAAWDGARNRLIVAGVSREKMETSLFSFSDDRLKRIAESKHMSPDFSPGVLEIRGSELLFLAGVSTIWGEGREESAVGTLDLRTDTLVTFQFLPEGIATDLALGPQGRNWVADFGKGRLLVFSPDWREAVERPMSSFWERRGAAFRPTNVDVDATRAVVAMVGKPPDPILEYAIEGGFVSDLPVREYDLSEHGDLGDVILLSDGRICASFCEPGRIVLFDESVARPFSGFGED